MTKIFAINELLNFAVKIEEEGIAFYKDMAAKAKNNDAKDLYNYLMKEEVDHRKTFQGMLNNVSKEVSPGTYSDEYNSYMRALVESTVFKKDDKQKASISNDSEAMEFAIDKEKDSILFYLGMKEYVQDKNKSAIDKVIEEERTHVVKLLDIKEKIG
ncbi:MAG: ferritin family protein [Candidatus Margulisbacteria bacterium]|nr:ferritin family protein [Candidatus Margulisiibacteriota bacterium]